jgi:putative MATE family efflux protein
MVDRAKLTSGSVGRMLVLLTLPMVFGIFSMSAFHLVDKYFVGKLGTAELAAIGFTFPVVMFVASIALGLGVGASAVISRAIGEGDFPKVRRLTTDSLVLALLIVIAFVAVGLLTIDPLFRLLNADDADLPLIRSYMSIWYVGMIFVVVPMVGNNAIRASGDTFTPALIMMIGAGINVVLDWVLIFGIGPFPELKLPGAALATVIGRMTTFTISLCILHFRLRMLDLSVPHLREMWESWKRILYIALPAAGIQVLLPVSMAVLTAIAAWYGKAAVAAVGVGLNLQNFAILPLIALGSILVPFIGQNWGAGMTDRVTKGQKYSYGFAFAWGLVCAAVFIIFGTGIARIFTKDLKVVERLVTFLWIVPFGYGMQAITRLVGSTFNAMNQPLNAAAVNLVRIALLFIPLAYLGARFFDLEGMFVGILVANILAGVISLLWVRSTFKTH